MSDDLHQLDDPADREARAQLLAELEAAGVSREELTRAAAEDRLVPLAVDTVFTRDASHSLRDAAKLAGLSTEFLTRNYLAMGLPAPDLDDPSLGEEQVEQLRMLGELLEAGLDEARMLRLAHVYGRAAKQMVAALFEEFGEAFLRRGDTELDLAMRLAQTTEDLMPTLAPLTVRPVWLHLREAMRHEFIGRAERMKGELPGAREVAVCFVDLVEFTAFSEDAPVERVGEVAQRLGELASQAAVPPVQVVKLIGDGVMLVGPSAEGVAEVALTLVGRIGDEANMPEARAGLAAGPALHRAGDWYGRTVNLASRLTAVAASATVVADAAAVERAVDLAWEKLEPVTLKGIEGTVEVFALAAQGTE